MQCNGLAVQKAGCALETREQFLHFYDFVTSKHQNRVVALVVHVYYAQLLHALCGI